MTIETQETQTRALAGDKKPSGKGCGCVIFMLVFLLGAALLGFWAHDDYRIFNEFVHAKCTVTGKRVVENRGSKGSTYRPEVDFTFEANGQTISATGYDGWKDSSSGREGKEEAIAPYQIGGTYDCWYDPQDPQRAVLVRHISWIYLVPLVLMAIGVFGGWMMLRKPSGPSREAALYQKQLKIEEEDALLETGPVAPGGGPGQTLAVRLGRQSSDFGKAIGLLIIGLFWNGIVGIFVVVIWNGGFGGGTWFAVAFLSFFALVGLLLIYGFFHQLLVALGVGETIVEISADRLAPGQPFEVFVLQAGRMRLKELTLRLVCEEKATYRQGTSTNTASEKVLDEVLLIVKDAEIDHGRPLQVRGKGRIPFDAMHGFVLGNNKLVWRIEAKGDVHRWPDFTREFAIEVRPEAPVRAEGGEA